MTTILVDKPFFEIKISAFGVSYYLELNNISIFKEMDSFSQVSTVLPVNHWMKSGTNLMGLILFLRNLENPSILTLTLRWNYGCKITAMMVRGKKFRQLVFTEMVGLSKII